MIHCNVTMWMRCSRLPTALPKLWRHRAQTPAPASPPFPSSQQHPNQSGLHTPTRPLVTQSRWISTWPVRPNPSITIVSAAVNQVTGFCCCQRERCWGWCFGAVQSSRAMQHCLHIHCLHSRCAGLRVGPGHPSHHPSCMG